MVNSDTNPQAIQLNDQQLNKKNLHWRKILIGGGCTVVASTITAIAIAHKPLVANQDANNSAQLVSNSNIVVSPSPSISPTISPTKSAEEIYMKDFIFFNKHFKYPEALIQIDKVLKLNPKNAIAWKHKGTTLENLDRYKEAINAYNKAIEINPNDQVAKTKRDELIHIIGQTKPNKA